MQLASAQQTITDTSGLLNDPGLNGAIASLSRVLVLVVGFRMPVGTVVYTENVNDVLGNFRLCIVANELGYSSPISDVIFKGINELFLLSTRTMQWFEERGFIQVELLLILHILIGKVNCPYSFKIEQSDPSALPITRKYDSTRGSKVYIKVKILINTKII